MPESSFQPASIIGHEGSPEVAPAFAYIVQPTDARASLFYTSYQEALSIASLPAAYEAADPQSFTPAQLDHSTLVLSANFATQEFTVQFPYDFAYLQELIFTLPSNNIEVTILRLANGDLAGTQLEWGVDTYIAQSGVLESFNVQGDQISLTCVPKPLHMALGVPRLWFSRACQHALYGGTCGLTKATFQETGQMTVTDQRLRQISIAGIGAGAQDADYFTNGTLLHVDSGEEFSIIQSTYTDPTATIKLGHFSEFFEADDQVELYPGCRHTVGDCTDKFSNIVNFGGFPKIPNRNPTIHST